MRHVLSVTAITTGLVVLAACGSTPPGSASLRPYTKDGTVVATIAGLRLRPGQVADFDAYIANTSREPVTVNAAHLVGLPGFPIPRLAHVARETGVNTIGSQLGWPPDGVTVHPLIGLSLPSGVSRIAIGVRPPAKGVFVVTGLSLSYGNGDTVTAWGGAVSCVVTNPNSPVWCSKHDAGVDSEVRAFIHAGSTGA